MSSSRIGSEESAHTLGLHHGEVLLRLANTYPTITLTIVEAVQNAIDATAQVVFIGIDISQRTVIVLDNGDGVTVEKFQQALLSVGKGIKKPGSLGRFGLGLISPLNKCARYLFTSLPRGGRMANQWLFVGSEIRSQHREVKVPFERLDALPPPPAQFLSGVTRLKAKWRTVVRLDGVTEDKVVGIADLDELEGLIRVKLGPGMRQKGTTVHIMLIDEHGQVQRRAIDPTDYTGEPLEVVTYRDMNCGQVTFMLYRAPKTSGERRGEVVVMRQGDNYPVRWREFFAQAMGSRWLGEVKEAFDALGSGYFEGIVYAENIELSPERTKFNMNEALRELYLAIHTWYEDHGQAHFENEREARREKRYEELGERSLRRLLDMFEVNSAFAAIALKLRGVLPDELKLPEPSERRATGRTSDTESSTPRRRRLVVSPPERNRLGQPRAPQTRFSLRFAYELLEHSTRLWEFDMDAGVLTFNVRHPTWAMLDETAGKHAARNDRQIMHLQEWLALKLLLLLTRHDDPGFDLELARVEIDEEVRLYAELFILTRKGE